MSLPERQAWCELTQKLILLCGCSKTSCPLEVYQRRKLGSSSNQLNSEPSEANCSLLQYNVVGPIRAYWEKDSTRAPERAEKGQVMSHLRVERLTFHQKAFAGVWRVGWTSQSFSQTGATLAHSLHPSGHNSATPCFPQHQQPLLPMSRIACHHSNLQNGFKWDLIDPQGCRCAFLLFCSSLFFPPQGMAGQWWKDDKRQGWNELLKSLTPTRNGTCLEAEEEQMVCGWYDQPLEASALTQILRSSRKEKGICITASRNRRNGTAFLGRMLIHKQENKNAFSYCSLLCFLVFWKQSGLCGNIQQFNKFSKSFMEYLLFIFIWWLISHVFQQES